MARDDNGQELMAQGQQYTQQTTTAGAQIGPVGARRCVAVVGIVGTGAVTIHDGTSTSDPVIWTLTTTAVGTRYLIDTPCTAGIFAVVAASTTVNIIWS